MKQVACPQNHDFEECQSDVRRQATPSAEKENLVMLSVKLCMDIDLTCPLWNDSAQEGVRLIGLSAVLDYAEERRASILNQVTVAHVSAEVATMQ